MIDLIWNTQGRISREAYRKARWRHFAFCLIPTAIYIGAALALTSLPPAAYISAFLLATVLLTYYRYRFTQVMVRRLHDRNMSGWWLLLNPIMAYLIIAVVVIAAFLADSHGVIGKAFSDDKHSAAIAFAVIVPALLMSLFLRYQLSKKGVPGANRYGPPTDATQANVF
jgi:uncharacterized membrane protein YhaH (DUF805 family)